MMYPDVDNTTSDSTPTPSPFFAPQPTLTPRQTSGGPRTGAILLLTLILALTLGVGLFAGWQFGRGTANTASSTGSTLQSGPNTVATLPPLSGNSIEAIREAVIARVRPAVVEVDVTAQNGSGIGSGVIIDQRGYIVTNNHVVSGATNIVVALSNGTRIPAQLVGTDATDDLAVIKITPPTTGLTVITLGDSSKLQVGEDVLAIGNPLGIGQTVTNGIISALGHNVSEGQNGTTLPDVIQTDAAINPGNSGGALVNLQGQLIGIPTLAAVNPETNTPANGLGFAIPSNRVQLIAQQLINTGTVAHTGRAVLQIRVADVTPALAAQNNLTVDHGAVIVSVVPGGPAAQAGLQSGDVIVQVGTIAVNDASSLG